MNETCGSCKHAVAIEPNGWWRKAHGYDWPVTHVHCAQVDYVPLKSHVIQKSQSCTFTPSRWESSDDYRSIA